MSSNKHFQRAARQMFSALKEAGRGAAQMQANASRIMPELKNGSRAKACQGNPVLQAWRQEQAKFAALKPGGGSFAASGLPSMHSTMPPHASCSNVQVRSASSTGATDAGEGGDMSTSGGASSPATSASKEGTNSDETLPHEVWQPKKRRRDDVRPREHVVWTKQQRDLNEAENLDRADPMEFTLLAKDSFLKKPAEMIPIPDNIREVLYRFNWDKVLVDVRRTIVIAERGKQELYTAMVAVGNLKGLLGLGMADAATAQDAVAKAHMDSYSNLTFIPLYRGHTIYHRIDHDFHHMKMRLMPRHDGWGVKASNLVSELCGLAGIKNISIKVVGRTKNKFYVAQCLQEALAMQSAPHDGVEGTGVYVREIFQSKRGVKLPMGLQRGVHVL